MNVPNNAMELRQHAVRHVVTDANFERFKDSIMANLQSRIFDSSQDEDNRNSDTIKEAYSKYMSLPGKYGTSVELCAMAELFGFTFCVIQQVNAKSYRCYDYGYTVTSDTDKLGKDVENVFLLFTGTSDDGHFRLLTPTDDRNCQLVPSEIYNIIEEYTTSKLTTITHTVNGTTQNPSANDFDSESTADE